MGAKASRGREEGSSVVMIVLGGGKREMYSRPVSAQEVMLRHPQHVLTHVDVLRSDVRKAIVTPETVLLPGNKYFLVLRRTVEWALGHHVDLATTLNCLSAGTSRTSDRATEPTPIEINLHNGLLSTPLQDRIIASPRRPGVIVEHKPQITFTEEQLHPARRRNSKGKEVKSPSHRINRSEHSQRLRRSSPKVCPGEDGSVWDEQTSDRASSIQSSTDAINDEMTWNLERMKDVERLCPSPHEDVCLPKLIDQKREKLCQASGSSLPVELTCQLLRLSLLSENQTSDGCKEKPSQDAQFDTPSPLFLSANGSASMQLDCSLKQETPACNLVLAQSPDIAVADLVNIVSEREVDLPGYQRSLESVEELQNMSLFELLKYPDVNVGKLFEDKLQCQQTFAPRVDVEVHEADVENNLDLPVVEPIEVHDHVGDMFAGDERGTFDHASARKDISCLDRDNVQHEQSQSNVFTEFNSHADVIDKPRIMVHTYCKDREFVGSPLRENIQVQVLGFNTATCEGEGASGFQQREDGKISELLLPSVKSIELQSVIQDQQNEGCASMPTETSYGQETSNLTLSFQVGGCKQPGQLYSCGVEDEITKLDSQTTHDSNAIVLDNSSDKTSSEKINTQQMPSVGNVFPLCSPKRTGLSDLGVGKDGKNLCSMSGVSSVSSPSLLPSSLSSLSFFSSSSSSSSSSSWSSSVALSSSSSSSSSLSVAAAAAPPSLAVLMGIDRPEAKTMGFSPSGQVKKCANNQQNLAMLGFSSLRSDSLSLFMQFKLHKRASLLTSGNLLKTASSKSSPSVEQDHGHYHRRKQERVEQQTRRAFAMGPPQPPIYHFRPYSRSKICHLLKKPRTKPLSPILEFSPELSPASLSPLSICPS